MIEKIQDFMTVKRYMGNCNTVKQAWITDIILCRFINKWNGRRDHVLIMYPDRDIEELIKLKYAMYKRVMTESEYSFFLINKRPPIL